MVDLYDETMEDIKQARNYKLFQKFSKPMLILLIGALVVAFAFLLLHNISQKKLENRGNNYYMLKSFDAASASMSNPKVMELISQLEKNDDSYTALMLLYKANIAKSQKDFHVAQDAYKELLNTSKTPKILKDLAFIQYIAVTMNLAYSDTSIDKYNDNTQDAHSESLEALLPMIEQYLDDSPIFKYIALEMQAHLFLQLERVEDGRKLIQQIIDDPDTPHAIVGRCKSVLVVV